MQIQEPRTTDAKTQNTCTVFNYKAIIQRAREGAGTLKSKEIVSCLLARVSDVDALSRGRDTS